MLLTIIKWFSSLGLIQSLLRIAALLLAAITLFSLGYYKGTKAGAKEVQDGYTQAAYTQAREAIRATERWISEKQIIEGELYEAKNELHSATLTSANLTNRLLDKIRSNAASAATATQAECRTHAARDGKLLSEMAGTGQWLATEAERLKVKATGLQNEVAFCHEKYNEPLNE